MVRFKDPMLRKVYTMYRGSAARGQVRTNASLRQAYENGLKGVRNTWVRFSMQHAAWAAGRDDRRGER